MVMIDSFVRLVLFLALWLVIAIAAIARFVVAGKRYGNSFNFRWAIRAAFTMLSGSRTTQAGVLLENHEADRSGPY
jgi:hypothetical protein